MEESIDIKSLKEGNESAFKALVDQFQDRVFRTCLGFFETEQEAEDIAQEVFIEVYFSIRRFREEAKLSTWIYRITVSKCLQEIRKKQRKKRFPLFYPEHQTDQKLDCVEDKDNCNHPFLQLENKERAEVLYSALNKLPSSQRVAFVLHKIEGQSYEEISKVMDTSVPSVESLIHRAKMNLRKRLQNYYHKQFE